MSMGCEHVESWDDGDVMWCAECGKHLREWSDADGWVPILEALKTQQIAGVATEWDRFPYNQGAAERLVSLISKQAAESGEQTL